MFLHLDFTKNLEYDRLTKVILKQEINSDSNTIDIGCHKGEILGEIIKLAPNGKHVAFEPLPVFFKELKINFNDRATVYPYALSDQNGITQFQFVKNAPAFSGIRKRKYLIDDPNVEQIEVQMKTLDDVIDPNSRIDFIKIDVEGGELGVLKGGKKLLQNNKPIVIFECGLGASDFYGTTGKDVYDYLKGDIGLNLNTIKGFVKRGKPLTETEFVACFNLNREYYFVAYP